MNPTTPGRATAYKAINCLGAVVSLSDLEDTPQVVVEYSYDPQTGRVLRGSDAGQDVDILELLTRRALRHSYSHILTDTFTRRPWWNWWRPVAVRRIVGTNP